MNARRPHHSSGNTFEALLGPNLRSVQTLVQRQLRTSDHAEDIVRQTLLRAFQRKDQLRVHAEIRTWLFRRDRSTVSLEEVLNFEAPDPSVPPLVRLERMERRSWVHACMAGLSKRDQAAIRWRDLEDKGVREAAAALNCSESRQKRRTSGRGSGWLKSWHQLRRAADREWRWVSRGSNHEISQSHRNPAPSHLVACALGLLSVAVIHDKWLLFLSMAGVGIAWASILSMPYAILSGSLPPGKTGIYMGIFNLFITLPEIIASLAFGWIMNTLLGNNRLLAVIGGGVFLIVAAILVSRVRDTAAPEAMAQ